MKKIVLFLFAGILSLSVAAQVMSKDSKKVTTINTTTLGANVKGYVGPVPVEIKVDKGGKIVSVTLLPSKETPGYVKRIQKSFLPKYEGKKVKDVLKRQPDAMTGATMTTKAIKENVRLGLEYYLENK